MTENENQGPEQQRSQRGSKFLLISAIAVAGGLALLASVQIWIHIAFLPGVSTVERLVIPGQKVSSALTLIALAVLASALVLTIAGTMFRRVLGVLLVLLGGGLGMIATSTIVSPLESARSQVEKVSGISGAGQAALLDSIAVTVWPAVMIGIGVAIALTGVLVTVLSGRWKAGGRKYEASAARTPAKKRTTEEPDRISDWEALSDGDDPTEER